MLEASQPLGVLRIKPKDPYDVWHHKSPTTSGLEIAIQLSDLTVFHESHTIGEATANFLTHTRSDVGYEQTIRRVGFAGLLGSADIKIYTPAMDRQFTPIPGGALEEMFAQKINDVRDQSMTTVELLPPWLIEFMKARRGGAAVLGYLKTINGVPDGVRKPSATILIDPSGEERVNEILESIEGCKNLGERFRRVAECMVAG